MSARLSIIGGYLGSGKTTLLRDVIADIVGIAAGCLSGWAAHALFVRG